MRDALFCQQFGKHLGFLYRDGADQGRLASFLAFPDQFDDGGEFFQFRTIDLVIVILADHVQVGRDIDHDKLVDFQKFAGFRHRRAGHAG